MLARLGLTFVVLAALSHFENAEEEGFTPLLKGDDLIPSNSWRSAPTR